MRFPRLIVHQTFTFTPSHVRDSLFTCSSFQTGQKNVQKHSVLCSAFNFQITRTFFCSGDVCLDFRMFTQQEYSSAWIYYYFPWPPIIFFCSHFHSVVRTRQYITTFYYNKYYYIVYEQRDTNPTTFVFSCNFLRFPHRSFLPVRPSHPRSYTPLSLFLSDSAFQELSFNPLHLPCPCPCLCLPQRWPESRVFQ